MKTVIIFVFTFAFSDLVSASCTDALKAKKYSLFTAIAKRDIDELKLALKQGADVNFRGDYVKKSDNGNIEYENTTPLMLAIAHELTDFVEVLVAASSKKDLDDKDNDGNTALMYAAVVGNIRIIDILVKAGADKKATNNQGKSAHLIALKGVDQSDMENYSERVKVFNALREPNNE